MLLEQHNVDILCLQETWITDGAAAPKIEGYTVVEQRRENSTRGEIATYV